METSKPFMMAASRTLRPDENPIDIIKEFFKQGGGGTLSLSDGSTQTNEKKNNQSASDKK